MTKVITYQAPHGDTINVTRSQKIRLATAGMWPKNRRGEEYCTVSHGLHTGEPTFTDAEIEAMIV
jgi:hypothetical protein